MNFSGDKYTILYINIVNNLNENGLTFSSNLSIGSVNDEVSGYTIAQIETSLLPIAINLNTLSWRLKSIKPLCVTDADIDNLLLNYF